MTRDEIDKDSRKETEKTTVVVHQEGCLEIEEVERALQELERKTQIGSKA